MRARRCVTSAPPPLLPSLAVGFQFVNQAKTVLIVAAGFFMFSEATDALRVASVLVGLLFVGGGVYYYTSTRAVGRVPAASAPPPPPPSSEPAGDDAGLAKAEAGVGTDAAGLRSASAVQA